MPVSARTTAPVIIPIWPQSVPPLSGAAVWTGLVLGRDTSVASGDRRSCGLPVGTKRASRASGERRSWPLVTTTGREASAASGERRSWPVLTTTAREASTASGERRSLFALAAAGATTAVARTAANVAVVLRV